jgi:hypothetical protein
MDISVYTKEAHEEIYAKMCELWRVSGYTVRREWCDYATDDVDTVFDEKGNRINTAVNLIIREDHLGKLISAHRWNVLHGDMTVCVVSSAGIKGVGKTLQLAVIDLMIEQKREVTKIQ